MPELRPFTIKPPVEAHARIGDAAVFVIELSFGWHQSITLNCHNFYKINDLH